MVPIPWYGEQKHLRESREGAERDGRKRGVSSLGLQAMQEQWSSAYWEPEPSLQGLWPTVYLRRHQGCDDRGATAPGGALTLRAALLAWPVPCGRRQDAMAQALYRPLLCHVACPSPWATRGISPGWAPRASGGRSGRDGALRAAQGEHTRGLARPGHADTAHPGVPHRGIAATRGHNSGGRMGRQHPASRRRARRSKMPSPPGSCRRPTRKPSRSTPGNPILVRASSTRCGSASLASSVTPWASPQSWRTRSVPSPIA